MCQGLHRHIQMASQGFLCFWVRADKQSKGTEERQRGEKTNGTAQYLKQTPQKHLQPEQEASKIQISHPKYDLATKDCPKFPAPKNAKPKPETWN